MNLFNRKYIGGWIAVLILGFTVGTGCDDPYGNRVDYSKMQEEETELRLEFFNNVRDSLMRISTDSILGMDSSGWVSYEIEKGSSDSVLMGKRVSFKYTYHYILRNEAGDPTLTTRYTNVGTDALATYTVGAIGQQDSEILNGVDLAIRHMSLYGKSYVIMSHSLAFNDYYPVVAEIEIVAMDLD